MIRIKKIKNQELLASLRRIGNLTGIILLMAVMIAAVEKKESRVVRQVVIGIEALEEDRYLIDSADVARIIERTFGYGLENLPLARVEIERLERVLRSEPFVRDAEVFLDAEVNVHIELTQREPVLRIIDRNGLQYYLDKEGHRLPLSGHYTPRILVATGNIPPHVPDFLEKDNYALKDLFFLAEKILEDPFLKPMTEQIYINNSLEYTLIPKFGRQKILLGKAANMDEKLDNLKLYYEKALPVSGWKKYRAIDLRYKGQIVGIE